MVTKTVANGAAFGVADDFLIAENLARCLVSLSVD